MKKNDPMLLTGRHVSEAEKSKIDAEVKAEIENAYARAFESDPLIIEVNYEQLGHDSVIA